MALYACIVRTERREYQHTDIHTLADTIQGGQDTSVRLNNCMGGPQVIQVTHGAGDIEPFGHVDVDFTGRRCLTSSSASSPIGIRAASVTARGCVAQAHGACPDLVRRGLVVAGDLKGSDAPLPGGPATRRPTNNDQISGEVGRIAPSAPVAENEYVICTDRATKQSAFCLKCMEWAESQMLANQNSRFQGPSTAHPGVSRHADITHMVSY